MRYLLSVLYGSVLAVGASAQIIDFQVLEHNDAGTVGHGFSYSEDGYTISQDPNNKFGFGTFGTQATRYPGSTALFNETSGGEIVLTKDDGGIFTLTSIDITILNSSNPVSVTFTGELDGVVVGTQTFTTTIADNALETFNFGTRFLGVDRVTWTQASPFHQFDNINVSTLGVQVMDFQGLAHNDNALNVHGFVYGEDGMVLTNLGNDSFLTRGTQDPNYPGSTSLFNNTINGVTELTDIKGRPFSLRTMDIANLNGSGPTTVNFVGQLRGVVVANQSFTTSGDGSVLEHVVFNSNFARVDNVSWSQDSPFHQFDNIHVVPVGPRIIDFERLAHDDAIIESHGFAYSEHGYTVRVDVANSGASSEMGSFGTGEPRYAGSAALFVNISDGIAELSRDDGARFHAISIDVANLNIQGPDTVRFQGWRAGVVVADQSYVMVNANNELETVIFNRDFQNLDMVTWVQDSPFNQFDNINVEPEPMIDFQALAHNDGSNNDHGPSYSENGFTLRNLDGPKLGTFGTKEARYPGSTALFNDSVNGRTELLSTNGSAYLLRSIDIANLNQAGPVTVEFVGRRNGNVVANQTFTNNITNNVLETFFFNSDFENVDSVIWTQDSPFHQFDNIRFGDAVGGCPADLDGDGDADADDFFAYLDGFAAGNLGVCDIDGDGDCDADDFFAYLDLFAQGC